MKKEYNVKYYIVDKENISLDKEGLIPTMNILKNRYAKSEIKEARRKLLKHTSSLISSYAGLGDVSSSNDIVYLYSLYLKQDWICGKHLSLQSFSMLMIFLKDMIDKVIQDFNLDKESIYCRIEPISLNLLLLPIKELKSFDKHLSLNNL